MASYSQSFPAFKRLYADFIALSQLAAALVVVTAVLFPGLRAKLAWRVLGLFWVLTGVNYYLKVVGGAYGTAMATVSVAEGLVLLVNWEKLRVFREVSCSTHLVLPMEVDLRSVNATIGCVGAFSLLVRVDLGLTGSIEPAGPALLPAAPSPRRLHSTPTQYGSPQASGRASASGQCPIPAVRYGVHPAYCYPLYRDCV